MTPKYPNGYDTDDLEQDPMLIELKRHGKNLATYIDRRESFDREQRLFMEEARVIHKTNSETMSRFVDVVEGLKADFIAPATGKKQVPTSVFLLVVSVLGVAMLLQWLGSSNRNVKLGPIEIWNSAPNESQDPRPTSDNR